jgi:hypothetical protein
MTRITAPRPQKALSRIRRSSRTPRAKDSRATAKGARSATSFLVRMETRLLREIRTICASLTRAGHDWSAAELAYIAELAHVIAHWHDDNAYVDESGTPLSLPLTGPGISLVALIGRVYKKRPAEPIVRALLRTGIIRRRGETFECTSRHIVFPGGAAAYLTGLISILGLVGTLRKNLSSEEKLLERMALNSHIPVSELPALYQAIDRVMHPALVSLDVDMLRRELRGKPGEPLARVGIAVHVSNFPREEWPLASPKPRTSGAGRRRNANR